MAIEELRASRIARVLEDVAAGRLSAGAALASWGDVALDDGNAILIAAWHTLTHFANDADVRQREPEYARYQADKLRQLAWQVRERSE